MINSGPVNVHNHILKHLPILKKNWSVSHIHFSMGHVDTISKMMVVASISESIWLVPW